MNRVLVAGIAGIAMLVSAGFTSQDCYAGRKCGGGGIFSGSGGGRCAGQAQERSRGGLLAKMRARKSDCCTPEPVCCTPEPVCCTPEPVCCTPEPVCCTPEPVCCTPEPVACCPAPVSSCGCESNHGCNSCGGSAVSYGMGVSSGCSNCSQTMDAGTIIESSAPAAAPPAPAAPTPDPAADAPSA